MKIVAKICSHPGIIFFSLNISYFFQLHAEHEPCYDQ